MIFLRHLHGNCIWIIGTMEIESTGKGYIGRCICLTTGMIQRCERLHEVTQQQSKVSQAEWRVKQFFRAERVVEVVNPYV